MRLNALLHPAAPPRPGRRLAAAGLLGGLAITAGASALAAGFAQGEAATRKSVHHYTSTTTPDEPEGATNVAVTVMSDELEDQGAGRSTATGRVEVRASGAPAGLIEVDGRPQPAGYDPRALQGRIARVETRAAEDGGQPVFNLITQDPPSPPPAAGPDQPNGSDASHAAPPVAGLVSRPQWVSRPTGQDLAAAYPAEAKASGGGGRATIECSVDAQGGMERCSVLSETPAGAGFGRATLAVAGKFRMAPRDAEGRSVTGGSVRIPMVWRLGEATDRGPTAPLVSYSLRPQPSLAALRDGQNAFAVFADRFSYKPPQLLRYEGDVTFRGTVPPNAQVLIDGRSAPAGFNLASLGAVASAEVELGSTPKGGRGPSLMRITTGR